MAVSVLAPVNRVTDANGLPYVNAYQYIYNAGTTTLRAIYTDDGLSIAADNPQRSNANGEFPRVFTAPGTYKLRRETSANVLIGSEMDDIDTGLSGDTVALPIAQGGTGATTAAAARANLGVPSTSELDELSEQVSDFAASLTNIVSVPQGRLTPTSATPIITTGVTAGTAVYYTPFIGSLCPIYDGAQFNPQTFAELTLTLNSSYTLSSHFDCFIINDGGTIRIVTGPAWQTITAGGGVRGTGAGTTELTRINGLLVNANAMATARNGSDTYSVAANQGTFVGTLFIDGTAGQITCHTAAGASRKWSIDNEYNRSPIILQVFDSTASWTYASATVRASNNASTNKASAFTGTVRPVKIAFEQFVTHTSLNNAPAATIGIGVNSTTTASGKTGRNTLGTGAIGANTTVGSDLVAKHTIVAAFGLNDLTCLEGAATGGTITFSGGNANMLMTVEWMG